MVNAASFLKGRNLRQSIKVRFFDESMGLEEKIVKMLNERLDEMERYC